MNPEDKIFIAGHRGLVGSALVRALERKGYWNLVLRTHAELDLTDRRAVEEFFTDEKPEYVFLAAAKVGGILANNSYPADFIRVNLEIETNVIHQSFAHGVDRLIFFGSSCIYPRDCPQPIKENYLLTGPLEPTNSAYAIAKIAGIEMCASYNRQDGTRFLAVMPTNLYGPGDNYDPQTSHVLPALIRKMHEAKANNAREVSIWGSGKPRREFLHSDDLAEACIMLASLDDTAYSELLGASRHPLINIGCSKDATISELAGIIADVVGFDGKLLYDAAKPDGTPQKRLDISRISALGWSPGIALRDGIAGTYEQLLRGSDLAKPAISSAFPPEYFLPRPGQSKVQRVDGITLR